MAHIEQTKKASGKSGGPQYYLQDLSEHSREVLRQFRRRPVRLWTPYGIVESGLEAVSSAIGSVGHDRVQSGGRVANVADQIAHWYGLNRADIEHIEFDDSFDHDSFVILPSHVKFFNRKAKKTVYPDSHPLTFVAGHRSALLADHLRKGTGLGKDWLTWIRKQLATMIEEHARDPIDLDERDLLRASGALDLIGVKLGMYRRIGIDCPEARFELAGYPAYPCPVEVEELSSGFRAPHHAKHRKQRAVLLCMRHDASDVLRGYIDIVELRELGRFLDEVA
jgi:hypothetical protein